MTEYVAHTETDAMTGLVLKIIADAHGHAEHPGALDDATRIVVLHNRYINPSQGLLDSPEDVDAFEAENASEDSEWACFPLFLFDHSGTTYRVSRSTANPFGDGMYARFDSGRVGIIALKRADFGESDLFPVAEAVAREYTDWANGNVFGYVVEDAAGEHLDSCWGFIGDYDGYVLEHGRGILAHHVAEASKAADAAFADQAQTARPDLYA